MRSNIGTRRSTKDSCAGDIFSDFEVYIGEKPRRVGSDDGLCGRGGAERQIFHGGRGAVVSLGGRTDIPPDRS